MRRLATFGLLLILLAGCFAPAASAQGCVMCRASAAAADAEGRKTLDRAIFILLIPTVSIFVGVFVWAFRRRNQTWNEPGAEPPPEPLPTELDDDALWRAYRN